MLVKALSVLETVKEIKKFAPGESEFRLVELHGFKIEWFLLSWFYIFHDMLGISIILLEKIPGNLLLFQILFYLSQNYTYANHPPFIFITNLMPPFWPAIL